MSDYVRITDRKIELTDEGVEALVSDYIPTTEEVSGAYNFWLQQCSDETVEEITEKFDRWLAEVKAQVWEEGYAHGNADAFTEARLDCDNPYLWDV